MLWRYLMSCACGVVVFLAMDGQKLMGEEATFWVYYGTYTRDTSRGIYVGKFDANTGRLTEPELAAETRNPSFLAVHPTRPLLYAVGELAEFEGQRTGAVLAYQIDSQSGKLVAINRQPSGGTGPCHLVVDPSGRFVLVANYGGGSVASLPIRPDGGLEPPACVLRQEGRSVHPTRQTAPHAHQINFSPKGDLVLVPDLGLDKVLLFRWSPADGQLTEYDPPFVTVPAGSGPRHFAYHPTGRALYVLNELTATVCVFECASGVPTRLVETVSSLPQDFSGSNTAAEIVVHPTGRFLFTSNRGHDSVAVFRIADDALKISLMENVSVQGKTPRFIGIDPTATFLFAANQDSHNVVVFRIDVESGHLTPTGQVINLGSPVCMIFRK
ncbi:MAG: lactonase family protein [Thermogutta sp.]|nr:lactonase family protein [Thermogutta sp.]HOP77985.1 lactonase family protein [Thermogutta sp.]HPU07302.1 lactonase family protein [Thermogutta sp.]